MIIEIHYITGTLFQLLQPGSASIDTTSALQVEPVSGSSSLPFVLLLLYVLVAVWAVFPLNQIATCVRFQQWTLENCLLPSETLAQLESDSINETWQTSVNVLEQKVPAHSFLFGGLKKMNVMRQISQFVQNMTSYAKED